VERLSRNIDALWNEARILTAEIRHGARADIIARARQTERIERDLTRRLRATPARALSR
jgi:Holliday junction resolvasome RuvABC ATP-dependent DNA helicase subunit